MLAAPPSTEAQLREWRGQQTFAERLAADVLRLEGFSGIDPQSPFGGPDGGKDLICEKSGTNFVAAVYFPHEDVRFAKTATKFSEDLANSLKHGTAGFIFFTNQKLTPGERAELEKSASAAHRVTLIYHRERIRVALDSPRGYGLRLRHLGIPLSPEEQFAYFASDKDDVTQALQANTEAVHKLTKRFQRLASLQTHFAIETVAAVSAVVQGEPFDRQSLERGAARLAEEPVDGHLSSAISPELIKLVHRLLLSDTQIAGRFRATQVWFHDSTGTARELVEPPPWDQVPILVKDLVNKWNETYPSVNAGSEENKCFAIAEFFHDLLLIHPFVDGNGRTARQILSMQCRDLFELEEDVILDKGVSYYESLQAANGGDFDFLAEMVFGAVEAAR
jgi:fido (protein-threonine AMPylation protein)